MAAIFVWFLLGALAVPTVPPPSDAEIHRRAIVVDTHADSTQRIRAGVDISVVQSDMHLDLPKMKAGGLDAEFFSVWVDPSTTKPDAFFAEAEAQLDAVHAMIRANPKQIAWARTAADVRALAARGVGAALFGVEGGHALLPGSEDRQIENLRRLFDRGARYLTLTWSNSNPIGGSSGDEGDGTGLTAFGRRVLDEMHRLGMVVDLSHVSDPLFWDAIRHAKKPVLATHSSVRALANVPRNMSDAMLKAVARNGGAVCINYFAGFLDADVFRAARPIYQRGRSLPPAERMRFFRAESKKLPPVPLSRLVDHIEHVAEVAGVDHVCLGSDFDGVGALPAGLEDVSKLPALTAEIRRRGRTPADIEKILGGNVLRVLEANEVKPGSRP